MDTTKHPKHHNYFRKDMNEKELDIEEETSLIFKKIFARLKQNSDIEQDIKDMLQDIKEIKKDVNKIKRLQTSAPPCVIS